MDRVPGEAAGGAAGGGVVRAGGVGAPQRRRALHPQGRRRRPRHAPSRARLQAGARGPHRVARPRGGGGARTRSERAGMPAALATRTQTHPRLPWLAQRLCPPSSAVALSPEETARGHPLRAGGQAVHGGEQGSRKPPPEARLDAHPGAPSRLRRSERTKAEERRNAVSHLRACCSSSRALSASSSRRCICLPRVCYNATCPPPRPVPFSFSVYRSSLRTSASSTPRCARRA